MTMLDNENAVYDKPDSSDEYDIVYKALMIGESDVGKTALLHRYKKPHKNISMNFRTTYGIDFIQVDKIIDNLKVRTLLWDTVGQERFRTITKSYFRGAKGVLLLYDITNRSTFDMVQHWVENLRSFELNNEEIYLVGNKIDLENIREVSYEEGKKLALSHGMKYVETSAKTGENVKETVDQLILNMKDANHPLVCQRPGFTTTNNIMDKYSGDKHSDGHTCCQT